MLVDTLEAFKTMEKNVYQSSLSTEQIKLSAYIIPWLEYKESKNQAASKRETYIKDVAEGKRDQNIVKQPLYDYQTEGMLHLAFKGRAILADEKGKPTGYKNMDKLHHRLRPILLRRRKHDVEDELPERINNTYFVGMHQKHFLRYDEYKSKLARLLHKARTRPLSPDEYKRIQMYLACMRMLCDTLYILDQECRISPKLDELKKFCQSNWKIQATKLLIIKSIITLNRKERVN
ncbi:MAG: SNF2-related protein [Gammaproteobacteria bacterium]|nr:SNF2-related protein [Gammaproteobacteria bacterium]